MRAFSYVWSLAVTWQRWQSHHLISRSRKSHGTCKPDGSVFYWTKVMGYRSLHCGNRAFGCCGLLWPWPWPDDFHIQTSLVLPGTISDVQIWTSYVTAFESYRLTDKETEIIKHTASRVLKKVNKLIKSKSGQNVISVISQKYCCNLQCAIFT